MDDVPQRDDGQSAPNDADGEQEEQDAGNVQVSAPMRCSERSTAPLGGRARFYRSRIGLAGGSLPVGHLEDVQHWQVALVLAELELGTAAQRVVRAGISADAAEDAAAHVELVRLEDARTGHQ